MVELGKVDAGNISLEDIAALLKPFLTCMATTGSSILRERLKDRIFTPLLESNVTMPDSSDDEEEEEQLHLLDQRKLQNKTRQLRRKTRKEIEALINEKYVFSNFNILIYAENHIYPAASAEGVDESNREELYALYNMAR